MDLSITYCRLPFDVRVHKIVCETLLLSSCICFCISATPTFNQITPDSAYRLSCFLGLPKGVCRMQRGGGRAPFHKFLICMILHEFRCMIDFIGCAIFSFVTWIIDWMNLQHKGSRGGSLVLERWGRDHGATPWPQLLWKPAEAERGGISSQPSGPRACGRSFHSL